MRAVLGVSVIVSAVLSRVGAPAQVLRAWLEGRIEMVMSPALLDELERVLRYPKIRSRIAEDEPEALVQLLITGGELVDDGDASASPETRDRADGYLVALARKVRAVIVTGDADLLVLGDRMPIVNARAFLGMIDDDD